jgi:L-threonylcarbamoyladenylate synthase
MEELVDKAIEAIRAGKPVLLPTDTVYALCTSAYREGPVSNLYKVKGREETKPTAIIVSSVDMLFECVPELRGRAGVIARALMPGPYTLVLTNPARRYRWLNGTKPNTIGVRVAELPTITQRVLDAVGAIVATSANAAGGPDPTTIDEVPAEIRAACAVEIDAGPLPGTPSTVIDFSGDDPVVLREGAASSADAIARVSEALAPSHT